MSDVRVSWVMWARQLRELRPTEALVLGELARLADWRGESVCPASHLVSVTNRGLRTVREALSSLEGRGLVVSRRRRRADGGWAASGRKLVALAAVVDAGVVKAVDEAAKHADGESAVAGFDGALVSPEERVISRDDDEGLRQAIGRAVEEAWVGDAARLIARSLLVVVGQQFREAVERGQRFGFMQAEESRWDTASWAWESLRVSAGEIMAARSPWALWSEVTLRASAGRNWVVPEGVVVRELESDRLAAGDGLAVSDAVLVEHVGIDDFGELLEPMVTALVSAGLDEVTAWAGSLRITELSMRDRSRRHTMAAHDPRLADLGVSPECAKAWMTLLVGSRRGGPATGLLGLDEAGLGARAAGVARVYLEGLAAARH